MIINNKKILFLIFFLSSLFQFSQEKQTYYLKLSIDVLLEGHEVFITHIRIGNPPRVYKMQIDFEESNIVLFSNLNEISTTYSEQLNGFDYISFWEKFYLLPITLENRIDYEKYPRFNCADCKGILGLSLSSPILDMFPTIGFSRDYLTLGKPSSEIGYDASKRLHKLNCQIKNNLCTSKGDLRVENILFPGIDIDFDPSVNHLTLPWYIYDEYMYKKNIYTDDISKWEKLNVRIKNKNFKPNQKTDKIEQEDVKNIPNENYNHVFNYNIEPSHYITHSLKNTKIMSIKRGSEVGRNNNTLVLGSSVLRDFVFTKTNQNVFLLEEFETSDSLSLTNYALFAIQGYFLIRWFVITIDTLFPKHGETEKKTIGDVITEWIPVAVAIVSLCLPEIFGLMEERLELYIGSCFVIGFSIVLKLGLFIDYWLEYHQNPFLIRANTYVRRMLNSFVEEIIIITSVWILTLPSRTEGGDSLALLIANIYLVFTIFKYLIIAILNVCIYLSGEDGINLKFFQTKEVYLFVLFTILATIYQVLITVNYFVKPFFIKNFNLDDDISVLIMTALFFFILLVDIAFLSLFIQHNIKVKEEGEDEK